MSTNPEVSTVKNILWNFAEKSLTSGVGVATTLILAWFLAPEDYALIGILAVYIAVSTSLVDAGLGEAIIRKLKVTSLELNTVFWTNLGLSIIIYNLVYFAAPWVASFYLDERLESLIKVVSISIFFQSLIVVQKALLSREHKFRLQVKIVLPAAIISSLISIVVAYLGYGVWALICQIVANSFMLFIFYWIQNIWRPRFEFCIKDLSYLWKFSKYIISDSLISIPFRNMYLIVLPKFFALEPVGLYFYAEKIKDAVIGLFFNSVQNVTYPKLARLQEDRVQLKNEYRKLILATTFLIFPVMILMVVLAPLIFDILLPQKWQGATIYFQLIIMSFILFSLHSINLNILKVMGRSDLVLYVGLYKKIIVITVFVYTLQYDIVEIIIGQIACSVINHIPNTHFSKTLIDYTLKEQFSDFVPNLILSIVCGAFVYVVQSEIKFTPILSLVINLALFIFCYIFLAKALKFRALGIVASLFKRNFKTFKLHEV